MAEISSAKKTKFSKNKKKGWRKVDISKVEDFLEDERLQERTGGLVSEKPDESLFFLDKTVPSEPVADGPAKRLRRQPRPLKCHALLSPDPRVKPAKIAKNVKSQNTKKRPAEVIKRQDEGHIPSKLLNSIAQRKKTSEDKRLKRLKDANPSKNYDLWSDDIPDIPESTDDPHYLTVTKKRRVNVPRFYNKKTSGVAAVEVPHPGASYNPSYDDYQDLLRLANTVEEKKIKEEEKIHRALDAKFPSKEEAPNRGTWIKEMSAGLNDNEAAISDSELEVNDRLSANPPVRRENLKTRKQRKTQKRIKHKEKGRIKQKTDKLRNQEFFRLKTMKKTIAQEERSRKAQHKRKEELKEKFINKPKKLGRFKFEEPELELKLSHELVDSLRILKPEGHLITDRFKSLQKRNILEPRHRTNMKRKYKRKKYEKRSHKDVTL